MQLEFHAQEEIEHQESRQL